MLCYVHMLHDMLSYVIQHMLNVILYNMLCYTTNVT